MAGRNTEKLTEFLIVIYIYRSFMKCYNQNVRALAVVFIRGYFFTTFT